MRVPLFDTNDAARAAARADRRRDRRRRRAARFILGPEVAAFEQEFARYCGTRHAVGVANGTDALTIALRAMGVGPGDEVIVPSFTFYATAEAVPAMGARPVFCDVDPGTQCISAATVAAALTPATKAVVAVHLFGNLAPVAEIEALGVPVLEDAAQAAGTRAAEGRPGALGRAATWSFFPSKNLACFGDGGAITTDDDGLAEHARMLRFHGSLDKITYEHIGYNSRLDELQAAILRVQLPQLDGWAEGRRDAARHYADAGLESSWRCPPPRPAASRRGTCTSCRASVPTSSPGAGRARDRQQGVLPHACPSSAGDAAVRRWRRTSGHGPPRRTHLALPMSPVLGAEQAAEVVAAVRAVLGS